MWVAPMAISMMNGASAYCLTKRKALTRNTAFRCQGSSWQRARKVTWRHQGKTPDLHEGIYSCLRFPQTQPLYLNFEQQDVKEKEAEALEVKNEFRMWSTVSAPFGPM